MHLLHFRRTFVEKMFALHGKVERLLDEDHPLGRDARHYSDLHVLVDQHEVRSMLASPEYGEIRRDYDERSRLFFPKAYRPPPDLAFRDSPALFPDPDLRARLEPEYEAECAFLFSDQDFPSFEDALARFVGRRGSTERLRFPLTDGCSWARWRSSTAGACDGCAQRRP